MSIRHKTNREKSDQNYLWRSPSKAKAHVDYLNEKEVTMQEEIKKLKAELKDMRQRVDSLGRVVVELSVTIEALEREKHESRLDHELLSRGISKIG